MLLMKVVGFILITIGGFAVFFSPFISKKLGLWKSVRCDFDNEMNEEDIEKYRKMKSSVNVKMLGMITFLPGLVMLLISFK
jgi:hypothetical protein